MRYNVAQLMMEPMGSTRRYQLDEPLDGSQGHLGRASGTVQVVRTHQGLLVRAPTRNPNLRHLWPLPYTVSPGSQPLNRGRIPPDR